VVYHTGTMLLMLPLIAIMVDGLSHLSLRRRIIGSQIGFIIAMLFTVGFHWGVKGLAKPYFKRRVQPYFYPWLSFHR
jgi:hypothetical protein